MSAESRPLPVASTRRVSLPAQLLRRRAWVVATAVVLLLVVISLLSPWIFPDPNAIDVGRVRQPPSLANPFGTDELGRDLVKRMAHAGRFTLAVGFGATAVSMVLGVLWGMTAATLGGWVDESLMRPADAILAIPTILFALVLVAAFGADTISLIFIIGLLMTPLTVRVARSSVLSELQSDYVRGLTAVGVTRPRILATQVLPNVMPPLLAQATLNVAIAIMVEASLSFVGLGVQPPAASWGTLLKQGYDNLFQSLWQPVFPALVILVMIGALNVAGEQLQKVLDGGRES
jgi:ABC-type dipeptide/oligopeptide/nickel transport system permease subunit